MDLIIGEPISMLKQAPSLEGAYHDYLGKASKVDNVVILAQPPLHAPAFATTSPIGFTMAGPATLPTFVGVAMVSADTSLIH